MTVAATITTKQYTGTGTSAQFSFPNKIFSASDLVITIYDTSGNAYPFVSFANAILGWTYNVQNVDVDTGCIVVLSNVLPSGWVLDIRSLIPELQSTSIKNQGQFLPELHEEAFDRATRLIQDLLRLAYTYGIHGPDTEFAPWPALPGPTTRRGYGLLFDAATGLPTLGFLSAQNVTQGLLAPLLNPQTPAESTAGITPVNFVYLPGDIRRYGADPTGSADSTVAIQHAINVAQVAAPIVSGYAYVLIPAGNFKISSTLNVSANYVRIAGIDRSVSTIYCATSGIGTVLNINNAGHAIFGVFVSNFQIFCQPGLGAPPVGFSFKDASECYLEDCRTENCKDGLLLNGINLCSFTDFEAGGTGTQNTAVHLTIQGTSVFFQNAINWMQNVDGFNNSVANILIGGPTYDLQIRASYGEECPYGVLVQNDSGVTALVVDRLYLDGVTFWSTSGESFAGGGYLAALPPAGSGSYLQMQNTVIANAFSNATNGQSFQILLRQNGNTNGLTFYSNTEILNGVFYGNCTSVLFSDATTSTGDMRGNIKASVAFQSGASVPLRSGSGTIGWGTEESGNWTPTDASGASLAFTSVYGSWVRKGVMVTATFEVTYPTTANGSATLISGLPFNAIATAGRQQFGGPSSYSTFSAGVSGLINSGASTLALLGLTGGGAALTNANMSANDVRMTLTYPSQ